MKYKQLITKYNFSKEEIQEIKTNFTFEYKIIYDKKYLSSKFKKCNHPIVTSTHAFKDYLKNKKWSEKQFKQFNSIFGQIFCDFLCNNKKMQHLISKHISWCQLSDFANCLYTELSLWDEIFQMICCLFNALKQDNIGRLFYSYKNINKIYYLNSPDFIIDYSIDSQNYLLYLEVCRFSLDEKGEICFGKSKKNIINHLNQAFNSRNGIRTNFKLTKTYLKYKYYFFPYKQLRSVKKPYIEYLRQDEIKNYKTSFNDVMKKFFIKHPTIKNKLENDKLIVEDKWDVTYNVT